MWIPNSLQSIVELFIRIEYDYRACFCIYLKEGATYLVIIIRIKFEQFKFQINFNTVCVCVVASLYINMCFFNNNL